MARYYDMKGKMMTKEEFDTLSESLTQNLMKLAETDGDKIHSAPTAIREYNNGKLKVTMLWSGYIDDEIEGSYFVSDYPLFKILVSNMINGEWRKEPISQIYSNRQSADVEFEDLLLSYTKSYYDENGEFVYEGNLLKSHLPQDMEVREKKEKAERAKPKTVLTEGMVW